MTNAERYIKTHERLKERAIYRIFSGQKARFIELLLSEEAKKAARPWEAKKTPDDFIDPYLDEISPEIPAYLLSVLPSVMEEGGKDSIRRYRKLLPEDYSFSFDIETSPASEYLRTLNDLYLSQKDGSILKTTRDELRRIMADGIDKGKSYGEIAKELAAEDPWVFSRARSRLIAINEVGRAYGWGNHRPAVDLQDEGYVLEKTWTTSHDDKVRPNHTKNEAAGAIALDKPFPGTLDQFAPSTNEIRCRCTSTHKVVAIKTADGILAVKPGSTAGEIKQFFDKFAKKV